jgi:hypothetical protein
MPDRVFDCANEVRIMNPRDELFARRGRSGHTGAYQPQQGIEDAACARTHGHGATQGDLARVRRGGREEKPAPNACYFDTESPRRRRERFRPAQFARGFVHGPVQRVPVNRGRAGVHPDRWRTRRRNGAAHRLGRTDAGFQDLAAISRARGARTIACRVPTPGATSLAQIPLFRAVPGAGIPPYWNHRAARAVEMRRGTCPTCPLPPGFGIFTIPPSRCASGPPPCARRDASAGTPPA